MRRATLYEVDSIISSARGHRVRSDTIYFQGHARQESMRARSWKEDQRSATGDFPSRAEAGRRLVSYPHPWLMPDFWNFRRVNGIGPLMAIYQARFNRYLENRGLKPATDAKVWAFLGDGETDEPESLGRSPWIAGESGYLFFVSNCNCALGRPVRGNGQIIQELDRVSRARGDSSRCCGQ